MSDRLKLLSVLIIEDNPRDQQWIKALVQRSCGIERVGTAETGGDGEEALRTGKYNCAIVDIDLPDGRLRGLELLEKDEFDHVFKIILTRFTQHFTHALLLGARRFIPKEDLQEDHARLRLALLDAAFFIQTKLEVSYQSEVMVRFFRQVAAVARQEGPVLIVGESGTGKELVARSIHELSGRAGGPFETLNCACLDPGSAEADLFGVEKEAFTGTSARPGIFERAHEGTVLFDEIGELAVHEQTRLLRILEHPHELRRHGGHELVKMSGGAVNTRALFATDRDLQKQIEQGEFHSALYQRITRQILEVPPLNDRREDVALLIRVFMRQNGESTNRISNESLKRLVNEDWTNRNVRGLWNVISRALVIAETREESASAVVRVEDIEEAIGLEGPRKPRGSDDVGKRMGEGDYSLFDMEGVYIERVLALVSGNVTSAAKRLGIGRNTLYEKVKRHNLENLISRRTDSSRS